MYFETNGVMTPKPQIGITKIDLHRTPLTIFQDVLSREQVINYRTRINNGESLEPIIVFLNSSTKTYYVSPTSYEVIKENRMKLYGGHHRIFAHLLACKPIDAIIISESAEDVKYYNTNKFQKPVEYASFKVYENVEYLDVNKVKVKKSKPVNEIKKIHPIPNEENIILLDPLQINFLRIKMKMQ